MLISTYRRQIFHFRIHLHQGVISMTTSSATANTTATGKVNPIPAGFHTVTTHLVVDDAAKAIDFYKRAFGAEECGVMHDPSGSGKVMHAMIRIGDSPVMMGEECPSFGVLSPKSLGNSPVTVHLYVEDADQVFESAVNAGATIKMPMMNAFWGDRYGTVVDPFGHHWSIATHLEDLTPEEMSQRATAACEAMAKQMQSSD
jgi:PhnB protein